MAPMNETDTRSWYAEALEVLAPLRWHLHELAQAVGEYNAFARRTSAPLISEHILRGAERASEDANRFFSGPRPEKPPHLLRARVSGDTIRDLIEALQQLDPDLKHDVQVVRRDNLRIGFQGERTRLVLETSR